MNIFPLEKFDPVYFGEPVAMSKFGNVALRFRLASLNLSNCNDPLT